MHRLPLILMLTVLIIGFGQELPKGLATQPRAAAQRDLLRSKFLSFDTNRDRKLDVSEYVNFATSHFESSPNVERAAHRDVRLFDWNHDSKLDLDEFFSIATFLPAHEREPIVDPIQALVGRYYRRLEEGFDELSVTGSGHVNVEIYQRDLAKNLGVPAAAIVGAALADTDKNGTVNSQEARAHLARTLGVKLANGSMLRFADGRVLKYELWKQLDVNLSNSIHAREFEIRSSNWRINRFMEDGDLDLDHDGEVSYAEYSQSPVGMTDTPLLFCNCDLDFDGELSFEELLATIKHEPQALVHNLFPAFDDDRNGKLSFAEFCLTPISNELLHWSRLPADSNQDQRLSFDEFVFGKTSATFPLLRWELFRRLDTNGDELLEKNEFDFRSRRHPHVTAINTDDSQLSSWKPPPPERAF